MEVALIQCTPDMLKTIWCAARTCYSPLSPQELWESEPTREEMLRIARRIFTSRHLSVAEHCGMTFAVAGVSRALLAQYSRHRIGVSLSVQSQRYVSARRTAKGRLCAHVTPPGVEAKPEAEAVYLKAMEGAQALYDELVNLGIPKEDARFVLPGGAATNFVTTLNLRSLLDIYHKRVVTPGAQWEIKELLVRMAKLVVEREPWLLEYFPGLEES
jgi:thymidylate synthase (FAD)